VRFGSPAVEGIPTETLAEMVRAGTSIESVANGYDLALDDVVAALGEFAGNRPRRPLVSIRFYVDADLLGWPRFS
jgi:uncharacterized protein (DUF433 family)